MYARALRCAPIVDAREMTCQSFMWEVSVSCGVLRLFCFDQSLSLASLLCKLGVALHAVSSPQLFLGCRKVRVT